jgi:L-ribulose-5-phosphate 3-epimerase
MMIKIALDTGSLISAGYGPDESIRLASQLDFEAIGLYVDRNTYWPLTTSLEELKAAKERVESLGLSIISVGPLPFSSRGLKTFAFEFNLAHPDEDRRRRAVRFYRKSIDQAVALGAPTLQVLPGKIDRPGFMRSAHSYRRHYESCVKSLRELAGHAEESGIELGIENAIVGNFMDLAGEYEPLFGDVRSRSLRFLFDVANANAFLAPQAYLRLLGRKLAHVVHVQDNFGDYPYHLPIGDGEIEFGSIVDGLRRIGWDGYLVPEIFPAPARGFPAEKMIQGLRRSKIALERLLGV